MSVRKGFVMWVAFCIVCFVAAIFACISCTSTNSGVGQNVLDSAKQLGELSEQNRQLTERVEREQGLYQQLRDSLGRAEADAASSADDVRGAIALLREYKYRLEEYFKAVDAGKQSTSNGP